MVAERVVRLKYKFYENHIESEFEHGTLTIAKSNEYGFRPYQLLVSSIASCSGLVFQQIIQKQRIELHEITIEAEVERNEDKANRVEKIVLTFHIKGHDLDEQKMQRNLEISRKHCSMIQSVEESIVIEEKLFITNL